MFDDTSYCLYSLELLFNNTDPVFCVFEFDILWEFASKYEKGSYFLSFKVQKDLRKKCLVTVSL